jgi:hypothetical protein
MIQLYEPLPLDSPLVRLLIIVIVIECGSGHLLDLQEEVKTVLRP